MGHAPDAWHMSRRRLGAWLLVVVGGRRSGGEGGAGRLQEAAEELWMKVEEHSVERRIIEDERR